MAAYLVRPNKGQNHGLGVAAVATGKLAPPANVCVGEMSKICGVQTSMNLGPTVGRTKQ